MLEYRSTAPEQDRTAQLLGMLPAGRESVLDIGARDGHFSLLLTDYFQRVTALDLAKPTFRFPRVDTVAGDVRELQFEDNSFDCVFCAEVLEHVPGVEQACREIARVAKHEVIIGVPYNQDLRFSRCRCQECGKISPAWGHINSFDEKRLLSLFPTLRHVSTILVGTRRQRTSALTSFLMDLGGNPWGTYYQLEPCMHCGAKLVAPENRTLFQKVCSKAAAVVDGYLSRAKPAEANWIHVSFSKD